MKRIKAYDDYNGYLPPPSKQYFVGAITLQFGNKALRHGWKIIEIDETD